MIKVIMLQPDVWYLSGGGLESMHLMIEDVKKAIKKPRTKITLDFCPRLKADKRREQKQLLRK